MQSAWRSRWAGVAASLFIAVGGGGALLTSDAAGVESVFVAVTPTRVLDTRLDVGLVGKFVSESARVLTVTGSVPTTSGTMIVVPTGATAIVMNVTVVSPSSAGFFSVRPGDAVGAPATSNLNFNSGAIVPNAVTVELPAAGNLNLYYFGNTPGSTTDLLIDVVGYFVAGGAGPDGDPGVNGDDNVLGPDQGRIVPWTNSPDNAGNVGGTPSIAVGVDGLPIIANTDLGTADLRIVHCDDLACNMVTITVADSATSTGLAPAITIGADGLPVIAHQEAGSFDLRVTHCNNVACTTSSTVTVDSPSDSGWNPSIAVGTDGFPIIAHQAQGLSELRITHCSNVACTSSTTTTVDSDNAVGYDPSIAIGTDGLAIVAHQDQTTGNLRVTHCSNIVCTEATTTALDVSADVTGTTPSIAIGIEGLPIIAHDDETNNDLRVTHCSNTACTSATSNTIDATNDVGNTPSITVNVDGYAVIAHRDSSNDELRLSYCSNLACSSATHIVIDSAANVGIDPSLAIGSDSHLIIAHRDATSSDLRFSRVQHMSWTVNGWES